jgi:hypothetical protein
LVTFNKDKLNGNPEDFILYEDNYKKHTSEVCKDTRKKLKIDRSEWPDLKPRFEPYLKFMGNSQE